MITANSTTDVFRYTHIRRARASGPPTPERPPLAGVVAPPRPPPAGRRAAGRVRAEGGHRDDARVVGLRAAADHVAALAAAGYTARTATTSSAFADLALVGDVSDRFSARSRAALRGLGLDPATAGVARILARIETEISELTRRPHPSTAGGSGSEGEDEDDEDDEERPYLRSVGIAELLIVRQHLKRYKRTDIAHVENVLVGETRRRTHRALQRIEETFTFERETSTE